MNMYAWILYPNIIFQISRFVCPRNISIFECKNPDTQNMAIKRSFGPSHLSWEKARRKKTISQYFATLTNSKMCALLNRLNGQFVYLSEQRKIEMNSKVVHSKQYTVLLRILFLIMFGGISKVENDDKDPSVYESYVVFSSQNDWSRSENLPDCSAFQGIYGKFIPSKWIKNWNYVFFGSEMRYFTDNQICPFRWENDFFYLSALNFEAWRFKWLFWNSSLSFFS